jgi:hypothetical protein
MTASYPFSDTFIVAGAAVNGGIVTGYKAASTLGGLPQSYNSVPPNEPDAGPVTTGLGFGSPGRFIIDFPTYEPYWICITYNGNYNWAYCPGASIAGANATYETSSDSGVSELNNEDGTLILSGETGGIIISRPAITGDVSVPIHSNTSALSAIGSAIGPIGSSTAVSTVSIDTKGRVVGLTSTAIAFPVTTSNTVTFTNKRNTPRPVTITSAATPAIDTDNLDIAVLLLATNVTSFTTDLTGTPQAWEKFILALTDNGSSHTLAWGTSFESGNSFTLPTSTNGTAVLVLLGFTWNPATSKWRLIAVG